MEPLSEFLGREPAYDEIVGMRAKNAIAAWDGAHPHEMLIDSGEGPYLNGRMKRDGQVIELENVIDAHGQILCNSGGYKHPKIEAARALARERGVDAFSNNFHATVVEWCRAVLLETLGPWRDRYQLYFVTSGTEANDTLRRLAYGKGHGHAELVNLRGGYSGAGFAANAACGNPGWKGDTTPSIPGIHFIDPTRESLARVLSDIPKGRYIAGMGEAGNLGVGGFYNVGEDDDFLRHMAEELRRRGGGIFPDEVQTGMGRTGRSFWASQTIFADMDPPEGMSLAKGVGGNHRGATIFVRKDMTESANGLIYNTFAENWEDLAAVGTAVQVAQEENWTGNAQARGEQLKEGFENVVKPRAKFGFSTHGRGLMFGVELDTPVRVTAVLRQAPLDGWVCGKGGVDGRVLRFAPPINVSEAVIQELIEKAAATFASKEVEKAA